MSLCEMSEDEMEARDLAVAGLEIDISLASKIIIALSISSE